MEPFDHGVAEAAVPPLRAAYAEVATVDVADGVLPLPDVVPPETVAGPATRKGLGSLPPLAEVVAPLVAPACPKRLAFTFEEGLNDVGEADVATAPGRVTDARLHGRHRRPAPRRHGVEDGVGAEVGHTGLSGPPVADAETTAVAHMASHLPPAATSFGKDPATVAPVATGLGVTRRPATTPPALVGLVLAVAGRKVVVHHFFYLFCLAIGRPPLRLGRRPYLGGKSRTSCPLTGRPPPVTAFANRVDPVVAASPLRPRPAPPVAEDADAGVAPVAGDDTMSPSPRRPA